MENVLHAAALWLHILGIALFVGPQVFLAFAWVPVSRDITDMAIRVPAMRKITSRFLVIGLVGLAMILLGGTYLISTWRDYYAIPAGIPFNDLRYGKLFSYKMTIVLVMLIITALHTFKVGPKQVQLMQDRADGKPVSEEEIARVRKMSMMLSISGLLLTLIIMVFGVLLTTYTFSLQ